MEPDVNVYVVQRVEGLCKDLNMPTLNALERVILNKKIRRLQLEEEDTRQDLIRFAQLKEKADSWMEEAKEIKKRLRLKGYAFDAETGEAVAPCSTKDGCKKQRVTLKQVASEILKENDDVAATTRGERQKVIFCHFVVSFVVCVCLTLISE